jgi:hypothetical protein
MSDKRFDDIIRSRLSGHESKEQADWQSFAEKMQTKDFNDAFDNKLASALRNHQNTSQDKSWKVLHKRYADFLIIRRHIHSVKLLEFTSLVLLLLLISMLNTEKASYTRPLMPQLAVLQLPAQGINILTQEKGTDHFNYKPKFAYPNNKGIIATELNADPVKDNGNTPMGSGDAHPIMYDESPEDSGPDRQEGANYQAKHNNIMKARRAISLESLAAIPSGRVESLQSEKRINAMPSRKSLIEVYKQPKRRYLHFFSAFDNNLIFTPDDLAYNTSARKTEMYGYSLGLLYSEKKSGLELETGLVYSAIDKPWNFTLQYGNSNGWYTFTFNNIHFDIVAVPMNIKHHFIENADWSMFASVGLNNSFLMQSRYQTSNIYLGGGALPVGGEPGITEAAISPFEEERHFTKGILQGGRLSSTYFAQAMLGLGIERKVGEGFSIYFSGNLHKNIINRSLGPNNDRIDKFSFAFGLKQAF